MKIKYFTIILFAALLFLNGTANSAVNQPDWFKHFTSSFLKINNQYIENAIKNNEFEKKHNFNTLTFDCVKTQKITVPVKRLSHLYLSFNRYNGELISGRLSNTFLIDENGTKHSVEFSKKNLEVGVLWGYTDDNGTDWNGLNNAIYKFSFEDKYVAFETETEARKNQIQVDIVSDYLVARKYAIAIDSLSSEILRRFPEANNSLGLQIEMEKGFRECPFGKNGLENLVDFYIGESIRPYKKEYTAIDKGKMTSSEVYQLRNKFVLSQRFKRAKKRIKRQEAEPVIMAIKDCQEQFPDDYSKTAGYFLTVNSYAAEKDALQKRLKSGDFEALKKVETYFAVIDEALLANPIMDFEEIMFLKRDVENSRERMPKKFGFPSLNSHNNTNIAEIKGNWHNSICKLSDIAGEQKVEMVFNAKDKKLITDLELDFDRENILFSMENDSDIWHVYETNIKGENLLCVTPDSLPDVNHFDACYLPDGNVTYTSDATYQGLPCEGGSRPMALLYVIDRETGKIRQLTFEQDSDFSPAVLNNGRLMYLRWEYSDLAHYFSRILMSCNPDGTGQMEYYGSNSYFPNTFIYARPLPDHPTKVIGIVGGHHGITRSGRLMIIDPAQGRSEADGVVHEIPHRGRKVEPIIKDQLVQDVWPQFIHPYPLNDKYFLVSAKLDKNSLWGIYLVDVFDNMTLIKEVEGSGLFDPIPVRKEPTPPVIPSRIREESKEATVFLTDIYVGDGLKNIPRGTVKELRLFAYHFAHIATGGHQTVGVESSWDIKRVLGTVPVEEDGSALFKIPANTPIAIQPLDSLGRALQIMRSWFVGMPGENVSCIGCHERTSQAPPNMYTKASRRSPSEIDNWQGNPRPFSFRYEVQPVLDKYCVSCHNGMKKSIPNFKRHEFVDMDGKQKQEYFFEDEAYMSLHPYVRRPGPESDIHLLKPMEYHAETSELVQLLQRGHHGVELENKDFEKIYAWIDLNAPHRGKWSPPEFRDFDQDERRKCLNKRYANIEIDPEAEYDSLVAYLEDVKIEPVKIEKKKPIKYEIPVLNGWPIQEKNAGKMQKSLPHSFVEYDLGKGEKIKFAGIPSGKFIKGSRKGYQDERKPEVVEIEDSFLMSECEITNAQYALYDSSHNSRFIDQQWKDHTLPGYPANLPNQPVVRISYDEALSFCEWLSEKLNKNVSLPSENQWEWACRAGTSTDFWYGDDKTNFAEFENLSDDEVRKFAVRNVNPKYIGDNDSKLPFYAFTPRIKDVNDGNMIVTDVASYQANLWGLYDMHGNVAEWTSSSYKPTGKAQDKYYTEKMKVVKGGSWRDRPKVSKSGSKRYYLSYQKVYNVGLRVVISK